MAPGNKFEVGKDVGFRTTRRRFVCMRQGGGKGGKGAGRQVRVKGEKAKLNRVQDEKLFSYEYRKSSQTVYDKGKNY